MKKMSILIKIAPFLILTLACSKSPDSQTNPAFQLPENIYTLSSLVDFGTSNNAADIRAEAKFLASAKTSDIIEARLIVVKATKSFTENQIKDLKAGNFFPMPVSSDALQTIKPAAATKDSDGDAIVNNVSYNVYIGVIGKENTAQLSKPQEITLKDRPLYAGEYVGIWEDIEPPGPAKTVTSFRLDDNYVGKIFYASDKFVPYGNGTEDAVVKMTIEGTIIKSLQYNQKVGGYKGGCEASGVLAASFKDDITIVLAEFLWNDCDGTRHVKFSLKKTR